MLRHLYGGTNRPHHLRLSRHLALALTLGLFLCAPPHLALVAGLGCICMEGCAYLYIPCLLRWPGHLCWAVLSTTLATCRWMPEKYFPYPLAVSYTLLLY